MKNTKKFIITPIVQTAIVGYREDPVYTFDELSKDVQRRVVDDEIAQRQEDGDGYALDLIVNRVWQGMKRSIINKNLSVMDFIQAVVDEYADEISQSIIYFFSRKGVQEELSWRGDYWTKDGEFIDASFVKEAPADV